jgi:hypothetical protein
MIRLSRSERCLPAFRIEEVGSNTMIVSGLLLFYILGMMLAVAKKTVVKDNTRCGGQYVITGIVWYEAAEIDLFGCSYILSISQ